MKRTALGIVVLAMVAVVGGWTALAQRAAAEAARAQVQAARDQAVAAALVAAQAVGQEGEKEKKQEGALPEGYATQEPSPEQMQEMMGEWMKLMQPSAGHKRLEYYIGKWDIETKFWMGGPGTEPNVSKGTAEYRWVLGGRFMHEFVKSEFSMPGPDGKMMTMAFEGMGLTGYDNFRQVYTNVWADNMGTMMMISKGNYDPTGKVYTAYGEMDEPGIAIGRYVKDVVRIVDEDHFVFQMFDVHVSEDYKVMEIAYTRQKP